MSALSVNFSNLASRADNALENSRVGGLWHAAKNQICGSPKRVAIALSVVAAAELTWAGICMHHGIHHQGAQKYGAYTAGITTVVFGASKYILGAAAAYKLCKGNKKPDVPAPRKSPLISLNLSRH